MERDIIIVGGGLSGLTTAYLLKEQGFTPLVLEANDRLGGRIKTVPGENITLELGATWVFNNDTNLMTLLSKLDVDLFEQNQTGEGLFESQIGHAPEKFDPSQMSGGMPYYKIAGGTQQLIVKLADQVGLDNIKLNTAISRIEESENLIKLTDTNQNAFYAKKVIITAPPKLLNETIVFHPALSQEAQEMRANTHTWMGDSIKFTVEYPTPFWRKKGLAGLAISNVGLVKEVQDHANFEGTAYGLLGFLGTEASNLPFHKREIQVIEDLKRIFGEEAGDYSTYADTIWQKEKYTSLPSSNIGLNAHQNNGHFLLTYPEMNKKLFFAGAETSGINSGYMEGAVISAMKVAKELTLTQKN